MRRTDSSLLACQLLLALAVLLSLGSAAAAAENAYIRKNLVSDVPGAAQHTDSHLVNPWGIAFNPFGFVWIADNGKNVSTLYDGKGNPQSLVVTIPDGKPTGIVFNGAFSLPGNTDFLVTSGNNSAPAAFLFATENGIVAGWSPLVSPTSAIEAFRSKEGAIFKGLAFASDGTNRFLYATDFHNGKIVVLNSRFEEVSLVAGAFSDPNLPANYAPFGIQNLNGNLYVTYALQDADKEDDVRCAGCGFVDVFTPAGVLIERFASRGALNAPWGLTIAPARFGKFSGRLLVGNFGDGRISAYDLAAGDFKGQLRQTNGQLLRIDGLWGLSFGNGLQKQFVNVLFFTAGPNNEQHGLYGRISPAPLSTDTDAAGQLDSGDL